jgi:hypothetical protein
MDKKEDKDENARPERSLWDLPPQLKKDFISVTFDLYREHISDASLGLDDPRCAWVLLQPPTKAQNLYIDASIEDIFVHSTRLQKVLSAKRPLRGLEESDKQRVLAFGQRNIRAIRVSELSGAQIESPVRKPIAAAFWLARGRGARSIQPPDDRAHPRKELAQVKGLRHIVVGAELEPDDAVDLIPAMARDNNDGHIRSRPKLPQNVEPVHESEPKIQDHDVDFVRAKLAKHLVATGRQQRPDVIIDEVVDDHCLQGWIVVDNEDRRLTVAAALLRIAGWRIGHAALEP